MVRPRDVFIGLSAREARCDEFGERVVGWIRSWGFEPLVSWDAQEAVRRVQAGAFAASLLDSGLVAETGETVWRRVRPILGRRLVLMTREPRRDLWFEALRAGVGAVLPLPPRESTVRAAIRVATGTGAPSSP